VEENKIQELTIVTDADENINDLVGAGVLEEGENLGVTKNLKISSALHGNVNLNSSNETDKNNQETTITLNGQFDNTLIYDRLPLHYTMKNLLEIGTTKTTNTDFRISSDEFYIKNTGIYYFLKNLGVYARLDLNSHIFSEFFYSDEMNYIYQNENGTFGKYGASEQIKTKSSFYPLTLKEGFGINQRVLNSPKALLNLRGGFGLRQEINKNFYISTNQTTSIDNVDYEILAEQPSNYRKGMETSKIGLFQLPFDISYTVDADFLFPFDKNESITMEWENILNVKLFKYISLDYKLKIKNQIPEDGDEYFVQYHSLFLRVTYFLK
jgi:hypothetical protein